MKRLPLIIMIAVLAVVIGGAAFLAGWDIPAPEKRVEKVLSNDRFPK